MQGIPLRGHRDDHTADPLTNKGVVIGMMENDARTDPVLHKHLEYGKKSQRYMSKTVQNQVISTIAKCLHETILAPLHQVKYYSIMADEVTDLYANQQFLSPCV